MNYNNELLLGILKDAKGEISECFNRHINIVQKYEDEKSKNAILAAAKVSSSSMPDGLTNIAAANDGKAPSQIAAAQLRETANSVDRALERWINELTNNFREYH